MMSGIRSVRSFAWFPLIMAPISAFWVFSLRMITLTEKEAKILEALSKAAILIKDEEIRWERRSVLVSGRKLFGVDSLGVDENLDKHEEEPLPDSQLHVEDVHHIFDQGN